MKKQDWFSILTAFLILAVVIGLTFGLPLLRDHVRRSIDLGPLHTFTLEQVPDFLSESLAIEKAQETMRRDGFNLLEWDIAEDDRSQAPDGTRDKYFSRNGINPNDGSLVFVNKLRREARSVNVELQGGEVRCQVWRHR